MEAVGGAEGDRTPDLVIANDALSQLSYGPVQRMGGIYERRRLRVKRQMAGPATRIGSARDP